MLNVSADYLYLAQQENIRDLLLTKSIVQVSCNKINMRASDLLLLLHTDFSTAVVIYSSSYFMCRFPPINDSIVIMSTNDVCLFCGL